jgi:hypothetical protein
LFLLAACSGKSQIAQVTGDVQNAATSNVGGDPVPQEQPVVSLPAGTPVTVRLQTPVSSAASESGEIFDAVPEEPLVVDGQTVAPPVRSFLACAKAHHSERLVRPHSRPRVVSFGM